MSGNKTLYTTVKCRSMTTKSEFEREIEKRLKHNDLNYYRLMPDDTGFIVNEEIEVLKRIGYDFIGVGKTNDSLYAVFHKRSD